MATDDLGRALAVPPQRTHTQIDQTELPPGRAALDKANSVAGTLLARSALRGVHIAAVSVVSHVDPLVWTMPRAQRTRAVLGTPANRSAVSLAPEVQTDSGSTLYLRLSDGSSYMLVVLGTHYELGHLVGQPLVSMRERPDKALLLITKTAQLRAQHALQLTASKTPR